MQSGNDQEMDGRGRVNIVKCDHILILVQHFCGQFTRGDFAENALGISHGGTATTREKIQREGRTCLRSVSLSQPLTTR